jgi:hypothetical protein
MLSHSTRLRFPCHPVALAPVLEAAELIYGVMGRKLGITTQSGESMNYMPEPLVDGRADDRRVPRGPITVAVEFHALGTPAPRAPRVDHRLSV